MSVAAAPNRDFIHGLLERFLLDLLEPVGRSERRHWGELYARGLPRDGDRKSIEAIAARLGKRMTAEL